MTSMFSIMIGATKENALEIKSLKERILVLEQQIKRRITMENQMEKVTKVEEPEIVQSNALGKTRVDADYGKKEIERVTLALEDATKRLNEYKSRIIQTNDIKGKIKDLANAIYVGNIYLDRLKSKWTL